MYKKFNLKYNTPFIGLFIFASDYIKLLQNFKDIICDNIFFIDPKESKYYKKLNRIDYPIGVIGDNIEIHFLHYKTREEAKEKWERRVKRINFENLLIKFSDRDLCTERDIEEFCMLDYGKKLCFSAKEYPEFKEVISFKEFYGLECVENEWLYYERYINIKKILNEIKYK